MRELRKKKIRERLGGIGRDVMRSTYIAVVIFAAISMFSLEAQAQDGAPAGGSNNLQTNGFPSQQSFRPRVVVTDPVGDAVRRRNRPTTLSMDTDRPGNTPSVGTANGGVWKRNRGLSFVDRSIFKVMSRQRTSRP